MKLVPEELLEQVRKVSPPEAEVIQLPWVFEQEDYNIAVVMPNTIAREDARHLEERLLDVVMDWDDAHDTYTVCKVWRQQEKALAGVS